MTRKKHIDVLLEQAAIPKDLRDAVYVAVPISGGTRLWDLAHQHKVADINMVKRRFPAEYKTRVLRPNLADAERIAVLASKLFPQKTVVNPAKVDVPGWSQEQYRRAWKQFISRFIAAIVASPGWSHSHGCIEEVLHAAKSQIPVFDLTGTLLSTDDIREELDRARNEAVRRGLRVAFLGKVTRFRARLETSANDRHRVALLCK